MFTEYVTSDDTRFADMERLIVECAMEVAEYQAGIDHGVPLQNKHKDAYRRLMGVCHDLAVERGGY